jgi:DNA-binding CsgD family transcriptional regulator
LKYDARCMVAVHFPSRRARYAAGGLIILVVWVTVALVLLQRESFTDTGPLSLRQPPLREPLAGGPSLDSVLESCLPNRSPGMRYQVVGGRVDGRLLFACYELYPGEGTVAKAEVVDEYLRPVVDVDAIKRGGAWPWVGVLNGPGDLLWAVAGTAALLLLLGVIYDRERSVPPVDGTPKWARGPLLWLLLALPLVGWMLLLTLPGVGAARRWWLFRRISLVTLGILATFPAVLLEWRVDALGVVAVLLPVVAYVYGVTAGRRWLASVPAGEPHVAMTMLATTVAAAPSPPAPAADDLEGDSLRDGALALLTSRELEVLRHLAMGQSNAEIAKALFVSEATVKSHVARMLSKLGLSNRVQAARFAYQHGLRDELNS